MEYYLVINDYKMLDISGATVLAVKRTAGEAEKAFKKYLRDEKEYAKDHGLVVDVDEDTEFCALYPEYCDYYTKLYIQKVVDKD